MPSMDVSARAWLLKTARKEFWRVAPWIELEDLIQDGYWHYQRIVRKYPKIKDRPHIMSLFKRTYLNHIHDLAKRRTYTIEDTITTLVREDDDEIGIWDRLGVEQIDWSAMAAFKRRRTKRPANTFLDLAPKLVREVIARLANEGARKAMLAQYPIRTDGTRETVNERLCRLCGYDPKIVDLAYSVRQYLSPK